VPRSSRQREPDYARVHQDLKRAGVTLQLLWEEYQRRRADAGEPAYKYTSFCIKYRAWAAALKRSMRQSHIAGERLFGDYACQTVPVIDAATGEIRRAQIFVAVLGASNYTYARSQRDAGQRRQGGSSIDALEFIVRRAAPDRARPDARPDRAA
jgi:transposase